MKHLFVICALAATFASCGNSETTNNATVDSTVVTAAAPDSTVDTTTAYETTATTEFHSVSSTDSVK